MFGDLDYSGLGAPGLDSLAQMSSPAYIEGPPHRIALQYGAPSMIDMAYDRGAGFQFTAPHRLALGYGAAAVPVGVALTSPANMGGFVYTLRADGGYEVVDPKKGTTVIILKGDKDHAATSQLVASLWSSGQLTAAKKGIWESIKGWFSSGKAATDIAALSQAGGGTQASVQVETEETFWDKYGTAIMIGGGVLTVGALIYAGTRPSAADQSERLMRANRGRKGSKVAKKSSKKSAKRKASRKSGRR
jgi:hypothetical protein